MKKNVKKYGLMTIAAVLLVVMAFAGAASAVEISADTWNSWGNDVESHITGDTTFEITGSESDIIYPKYNGSTGFTPEYNLTLDFAGYQGTFSGENASSPKGLGALFGYVNLSGVDRDTKRTLTIKNLSLTNVKVNAISDIYIGGIVGYFKGNSTTAYSSNTHLNFTNCRLENCSIKGKLFDCPAGVYNAGGLVGGVYSAIVNVNNCGVKHCDVVSRGTNVAGLVGHADAANFDNGCIVENCTIANIAADCAGGLIGASYNVSFAACDVKNTSVYTHTYWAGGLIGLAARANNVDSCNVTNCIVVSGTGPFVGGLIGDIEYGSPSICHNITGCWVMNCTFSAATSGYGGGLIGTSTVNPVNSNNNHVEWCAVIGTGNGASARIDCGGTWKNFDCTAKLDENFIYNLSYKDDIKLYDVNGNQITSLSAVSTTFWNTIYNATGYNASKFGGDTQQVTYLGRYGAVDGYGACLPTYTVTYDGNNATSGDVPQSQTDLAGTIITVAGEGNLAKLGYNFTGWNFGTMTGELKQPGNIFTLTADTSLYANWTVYSAEKSTSSGIATFNDNANVVKMVAIQNASTDVSKVNITYEPDTEAPSSDGSYTRTALTPVFNITLTGDLGSDNVTIGFALLASQLNGASPDSIYLAHKKNGAWEYLKPTYVQTGDLYEFLVTGVTSFSPFVPISMTAVPQKYTPSSSKQTGSTIILQEGQTAPTASATAAPTVAPTVKPTEKPATPTVIATEKPTTQATQQSPAPFIGILAGLGAAALVLNRLRK